ncbi:RNA polymerase III RPC4-domain-containing protein [Lipomyces oligophaga]|uniref:RNA polymerase III RPC4-domain-containing protein n=1 Tax=Lipomyces oligophaga TaxID=45792 RepID=UPI0034D001A3
MGSEEEKVDRTVKSLALTRNGARALPSGSESSISTSLSSTFPILHPRLDSLSRNRISPSGPSDLIGGISSSSAALKFKPKLVARRTKEERDASAPVSAESIPHTPSPRGGRGGRGSRRGGRVKYEARSTVASGPFADPVFGDSRVRRSVAVERRPINTTPKEPGISLLQALAKNEYDTEITSGSNTVLHSSGFKIEQDGQSTNRGQLDDSDDESTVVNGIERINIAKVGNMTKNTNSEIGRYFPVREVISTEPISAAEEAVEDNTAKSLEEEEFTRVFASDELDSLERKLFCFQLGPMLPELKLSGHDPNFGVVKRESPFQVKSEVSGISPSEGMTGNGSGNSIFNINEDGSEVKTEDSSADDIGFDSVSDGSEGLVGRLIIRKSGRVSLIYGGIEMDVNRGSQTEFLQDIVVIDDTPDNYKATLLGQVVKKVVATPNIDSLFDK